MCESMLPYTALVSLNALSSSKTDSLPISPACHISSHFLKCLNTAGSKKEWVSDSSQIRVILLFHGYLKTIYL